MVVFSSNLEAAQGLSERGLGKIDWIIKIRENPSNRLIHPNHGSDKQKRLAHSSTDKNTTLRTWR